MKLLVMIWCGILVGASFAHGQNAPAKGAESAAAKPAYVPHLAFDVVSIHESGEGNMSYIDNVPHNSLFMGERLTAQGLILTAFGIKQYFLLTGDLPTWARDTHFSITAKSDASIDELLTKLGDDDVYAEKRHMLQGMLADRFKLKIHAETRESEVFELFRTKQAEKLMTPVPDSSTTTPATCSPSLSHKGADIEAKGCSFANILNLFQREMATNVIDHTGMTGKYAFSLKWCPDAIALHCTDEDRYPYFVDAVREQLGLELKRTKGPVTFWVVDHIEPPSAN